MSSNRIAVAGSRLTDPALLGNLACRYVFSDPNTLTQATNGTGAVPGNGDPVGYAFDQSGNGYHINAVGNGNRPTWQSNVQGAIGAALFDGTDDYLERAVSNITANRGALSIYAVIKHAVAPTGREAYLTASTGNNTTARVEHGSSLATADRVRVVLRRENANTPVTLNGTDPVGTALVMGATVIDYTNNTVGLYLNNVLQASGTPPGTPGANTQNTNGKLFIGGAGAGAGNINGHMFELLMYWEAHNADQRRAVWNHLRNKYQF